MNGSAAERVHGPSLSSPEFFSVADPGWPEPPPPHPYLKVWIQHCYLPPKLLQYVTYVVTLRSHGRAEAGGHKEELILLLKVH